MEDISKKFSELMGLVTSLAEMCKYQTLAKQVEANEYMEKISELAPDIQRYIARKEVRDAQAEALKVVNKNLDILIREHNFKFYIQVDKVMHEIPREDYYKCVGWIKNGN